MFFTLFNEMFVVTLFSVLTLLLLYVCVKDTYMQIDLQETALLSASFQFAVTFPALWLPKKLLILTAK